MICPNCKFTDARVLETRSSKQKIIRTQRKYQCLNCEEIYVSSIITPENLKIALTMPLEIDIKEFS